MPPSLNDPCPSDNSAEVPFAMTVSRPHTRRPANSLFHSRNAFPITLDRRDSAPNADVTWQRVTGTDETDRVPARDTKKLNHRNTRRSVLDYPGPYFILSREFNWTLDFHEPGERLLALHGGRPVWKGRSCSANRP